MNNIRTNKLYTWIAIALFVIVFAALLTVATLFDLDISKIMTKNALPEGNYFSTSGFGLFFEAVGSAPVYIMGSIVGVILFWWGIRKDNLSLRVILTIVGAVAVFVGLYLFINDIFKYIGEHMHDEEYMGKGYVQFCILMLTLINSVLLVLTWKNVGKETNDKLIIWVLVILGVIICYLVVHFVKGPVGRMRYRAMNYSEEYGFEYFTRWYVVNGERNLVPVAHGVEISDSCKSFPSGHTYSAGVIYTLVCLPDLLEKWNKKWIKAVIYSGTAVFTGIVAISRIVVGAHFMSDVLFGGTLSFLACMLFREIFIFRFAHFKNLFSKKSDEATEKENISESESETETVA